MIAAQAASISFPPHLLPPFSQPSNWSTIRNPSCWKLNPTAEGGGNWGNFDFGFRLRLCEVHSKCRASVSSLKRRRRWPTNARRNAWLVGVGKWRRGGYEIPSQFSSFLFLFRVYVRNSSQIYLCSSNYLVWDYYAFPIHSDQVINCLITLACIFPALFLLIY